MGEASKASVELIEPGGRKCGSLKIWVLPGQHTEREAPPLLDFSKDVGRNRAQASVQLLEGKEYRYELELAGPAPQIQLEPKEMFLPDDDDALTGRLRPRLYTGTVRVSVWSRSGELAVGDMEVRSRKLGYLAEYQWMMRDISTLLTELILNRFAPARVSSAPTLVGDAKTLYQRFAFLQSFIFNDDLDAAMVQILSRPHRQWLEEIEASPPGRPVAPSSQLVRQLVKPGPRVPFEGINGLDSLPAQLWHRRAEETLDTPENRFVKFALTTWTQLVVEVGVALRKERATSPVERGLREVEAVAARLDEYLAAAMFQEVGDLSHLPAGSQVLQKRVGYRDIFRLFLQGDLAAALAWQGGEDVFSAGQRNVAVLYEYWVFIQLAREVGRLCGDSFDLGRLVELRPDGMQFAMKRGDKMKPFTGRLTRLGRIIELGLHFNRSFTQSGERTGSWTRKMTPDCSLECRVGIGTPQEQVVWLHFDAKYRIDHLDEIFRTDEPIEDDENGNGSDTPAHGPSATSADLLKMHAYRDAIRRSAGAYVLYPGTGEPLRLRQYHELLPGLGAFALRPSESGDVQGIEPLRRFLDEVITHVASQVTQDERARHWVEVATADPTKVCPPVPAATFLKKPPADVNVLVGFVRNARHLEWIHKTGRYNVRAGTDRPGGVTAFAQEVMAEVVVLHNESLMPQVEIWAVGGPVELWTREAMAKSRYPGSPGERYFCLNLGERVRTEWESIIIPQWIHSLRRRSKPDQDFHFGIPLATTWLELVRRST